MEQGSPLQSMTPKQIFLFGVIEGILVLCTIGFFILLGIVLGGGSANTAALGVDNNNVIAPSPDAPTNVTVRAVDTKADHIRGAKNPKVTIVEYSDPECPFCKRFHTTMKQVVEAYKDDVRWVYRHFPLDSLHQQARTEALALECAGEQGKFWEYTDLLYQETPSNDGLDLAKLPEFARRLNLNVNQFNTCHSNQKYASRIQADEQDAQRAGARGTPYSVAIGPDGETVPISGAVPFEQIKATIDSLLQ